MLARYLLAALSFVLAGVVLAQDDTTPNGNGQVVTNTPYSLIYYDYTSGKEVGLPVSAPTHPNDFDTTYDTSKTSFFKFGVDWAGDVDTVTITPPAAQAQSGVWQISNDQTINPQCNPTATDSTTGAPASYTIYLSSTNAQCNYTVRWSSAFTGGMTVTWLDSAATPNSLTDSISVFFSASVITGDPQFVGLRGQSYQVHGIDGAVYNIISEQNTQVNSRFVFLTEGQCPMINGVADTNCWSHPGSYLGEMSFQQMVDGKLHAALIVAGPAKSGFAGVQVDGKVVAVGATVSFGSFSLTARTAYSVQVKTEHFEFELSNSDMFINQGVRATVPLNKLQAHGLLGQTSSTQTYSTSVKYIAGSVDDYVIADSDIFGDDFVYNMFQQ
jgi:hypothetical protein